MLLILFIFVDLTLHLRNPSKNTKILERLAGVFVCNIIPLLYNIISGGKLNSRVNFALNFFSIKNIRVHFTISTFCMAWKDTIFSVISILNFFKSFGSQTFMKTKIILKSNTIVFDPFYLFVFVNICLLMLFKKFNMDIT